MTKFLSIPHFNCLKFFCYSKWENESSVPLLGPIAAGKDAESTPAPTKIVSLRSGDGEILQWQTWLRGLGVRSPSQ